MIELSHLSDKTAVVVGHSVGDDLRSTVRQLDCVGALGGEIKDIYYMSPNVIILTTFVGLLAIDS